MGTREKNLGSKSGIRRISIFYFGSNSPICKQLGIDSTRICSNIPSDLSIGDKPIIGGRISVSFADTDRPSVNREARTGPGGGREQRDSRY